MQRHHKIVKGIGIVIRSDFKIRKRVRKLFRDGVVQVVRLPFGLPLRANIAETLLVP
jgi:hypothetical protein